MIAFVYKVGEYELERLPGTLTREYKLESNLLKHGVPNKWKDCNVYIYNSPSHIYRNYPDKFVVIRDGKEVRTTVWADDSNPYKSPADIPF
tara:strand:+ start:3963 stop:4235 length:273 start_codon:yes stop_codon:yes gene_type:complete